MSARLIASCLVLLIPIIVSAQAPRVISFQGYLTDSDGNPVSDGSRTVVFKIYTTPSSGSPIWSESRSVSTAGGTFSIDLGSVTPLTGFRMDRELWLGIAISTDPEMTPRTRLSSAPAALTIASPLQDTLKIKTADLATDESERRNEDVTIWSNDAMIGLYSNPGGVAGSGFQLGEISSGLFTNKWSIYRGTTGAGAELLFTFGTDPAYAVNPARVRFGTDGTVSGSSFVASDQFRYDGPKARKVNVPAANFTLEKNDPLTGLIPDWKHELGYIVCYSCVLGGYSFVAPVSFPDGAEIVSFTFYYMDNDAGADTEISATIRRRGLTSSSTQTLGSSPVTTSGASTSVLSKTIDTSANAFRVVDNDAYMYWVEFEMDHVTSASWSARRFYGMTIEYEVETVE